MQVYFAFNLTWPSLWLAEMTVLQRTGVVKALGQQT